MLGLQETQQHEVAKELLLTLGVGHQPPFPQQMLQQQPSKLYRSLRMWPLPVMAPQPCIVYHEDCA